MGLFTKKDTVHPAALADQTNTWVMSCKFDMNDEAHDRLASQAADILEQHGSIYKVWNPNVEIEQSPDWKQVFSAKLQQYGKMVQFFEGNMFTDPNTALGDGQKWELNEARRLGVVVRRVNTTLKHGEDYKGQGLEQCVTGALQFLGWLPDNLGRVRLPNGSSSTVNSWRDPSTWWIYNGKQGLDPGDQCAVRFK